MFDGRIYRAAFVPLLFVLVVAGFSLAGRPGSLRSTLAPDAFDGARAYAGLQALAKRYPDRRPGSVGDNRLAAYIAQTLRGLGGPPTVGGPPDPGGPSNAVGGSFQVSTRQVRAPTIDGTRTLTTVIAERPGSTGSSPIAILAHRDSAARGSVAELSGTAALLELASVFSQSATRRTIVLVSTSGGSGGDAGAADFARHGTHPLDAALVLGDLAGEIAREPFVLPFSEVPGAAPESLQRTLDAAISQEVGAAPGVPAGTAQLAHLALPLATGEEAPLNGAGVPSVLVQVSGERGPAPGERVAQARLLNLGRAVLSATYALDEGPDVGHDSAPRLSLGRKLLPGWAIGLLVLALLFPPLFVSIDALARLRRRREPILRWVVWALSCSLPFLTCALFAILLGTLGIVAAPAAQVPAASLSAIASAPGAVASVALVLVLALLAWPALVRRLSLPVRPSSDGAAVAVMLVLLAVCSLAWVFNPFACLMLVPAAHLWLLAVEVGRRPSSRARGAALLAILAGVLPVVLLLVLYARELGLGPGGLAESAVLALAGGQLGLLAALLWSAALGCLVAVIALAPARPPSAAPGPPEWIEQISTRGPTSYAGPGSLGGTESALRR
ncbi:MAG: M28 family peptidase [Solirubrobacteraceae bacterium]